MSSRELAELLRGIGIGHPVLLTTKAIHINVVLCSSWKFDGIKKTKPNIFTPLKPQIQCTSNSFLVVLPTHNLWC